MYSRPYCIYKPNKTVTGAGLQLSISKGKDDKTYSFLAMANEIKEAPKTFFTDKAKNIVMKLGETDITKLLVGLKTGEEVKLYHQTETSVTNLNMKKAPDGKAFFLNMSKKVGNDSNMVKISVQPDEAEGMRIVLERALLSILGM